MFYLENMGVSQSTVRAAKFSGTSQKLNEQSRNTTDGSTRSTTLSLVRRTPSNVNRNCKEFSKYWTGGGSLQPKQQQQKRIRRRHSSISRSMISSQMQTANRINKQQRSVEQYISNHQLVENNMSYQREQHWNCNNDNYYCHTRDCPYRQQSVQRRSHSISYRDAAADRSLMI
jgi:hypothetical protein